MVEGRRRRRCRFGHDDPIAGLRVDDRPDDGPYRFLGTGLIAVGREAEVHHQLGVVGHHVAGHAAFDAHGL